MPGTHLEPLSGLFWAILDILEHRRPCNFIGLSNSTTCVKPVRVGYQATALCREPSSKVANATAVNSLG